VVAGPGTKVHRILRRVPNDGRHPGSSRAASLHGQAVTVVSAAPSQSEKRRRRSGSQDWKKERRQGCQRLGRSRAPWEENAHARSRSRPTTCEARGQRSTQHAIYECCVLDDPPKRIERRESARSPGQAVRSPNSGRRPRGENRGRQPGTYEVRVHAVSSGWQKSIGRVARLAHREVASPRGEEIRQGASQKEARSLTDARHEWREGESVRG